MTVHIQLDCPHEECLTEKAGFSANYCVPSNRSGQDFLLFFQCGVCGNGIIAKYRGANQGIGDSKLIETWPKRLQAEAPQYLSVKVARFYLQGMDNLKRKNYDAAGTMFRKSLDIGLKTIDPSGKGPLEKRINNLPDTTGITPAMKEWAHQIRHLGNDAAHEDDPFTSDEASALQSFTELFLTYAFTLLGMLAERRDAKSTPVEVI